MSNFKKKHKILELIFINEREKTLSPKNYTTIGKGLSIMQIHDKLGYSMHDIEIICSNLTYQGYLEVLYYKGGEFGHGKAEEPVYCILSLGKQAFHDKILLNQVWYRSRSSMFSLIALLISLAALLVSGVSAYKSHSHILKQTEPILKHTVK